MEETNAITNRQKYANLCLLAQQLIIEINLNPNLKNDQTVNQIQAQLKRCLSLPVTNESLEFFERQMNRLRMYKEEQTSNTVETAGEEREFGYVMVKKSGRAYIPVEEEAIEVPNYDVPVRKTNGPLKEMPDFIFKDKTIPVVPVTSANRGSSHVWMLAFLTFLFESLFLLGSFFLYK